MAPPKASTSKKRKTKEIGSGSSSYNEFKFLSLFHQNQFYGWVSKSQINTEVGFQLGRNEHREINIYINNRGWTLLCNPPKVVESLVWEFYANAVPQPGQPYDYKSYVSYEEKVKQLDPRFEEILNEICVVNVQWINDNDGRPNQLRRRYLSPKLEGD
ncbi:hypothetical protein AHAS_Ahas02G0167800 [Arachis hypogaea]